MAWKRLWARFEPTTFFMPLASAPTGPPPLIQSATTQAISTSPIPSTVSTSWTAPLLAVPWLWPGNMDIQSQYVAVGPSFPVIPRRLLERMQRWEYINFSQLIPFCEEEELDLMQKAKYVLFPEMEAQLGEGRHQDYSFEQWALCFILYMAAMARKFPEAILDSVQSSKMQNGVSGWHVVPLRLSVSQASSCHQQQKMVSDQLGSECKMLHWKGQGSRAMYLLWITETPNSQLPTQKQARGQTPATSPTTDERQAHASRWTSNRAMLL